MDEWFAEQMCRVTLASVTKWISQTRQHGHQPSEVSSWHAEKIRLVTLEILAEWNLKNSSQGPKCSEDLGALVDNFMSAQDELTKSILARLNEDVEECCMEVSSGASLNVETTTRIKRRTSVPKLATKEVTEMLYNLMTRGDVA